MFRALLRTLFRTPGAPYAIACGALLFGAHSAAMCAEYDGDRSVLNGVWTGQMRYRFESVDEDRPLHSANASTLRTRLGFETNPLLALGAMLEIEDVRAIGAEDFNTTTTGHGGYSVVPDPEATEINQAYITARHGSSRARAGRQNLVLDNARFIEKASIGPHEKARVKERLGRQATWRAVARHPSAAKPPSAPRKNSSGCGP